MLHYSPPGEECIVLNILSGCVSVVVYVCPVGSGKVPHRLENKVVTGKD